jgi:hypothetical protein
MVKKVVNSTYGIGIVALGAVVLLVGILAKFNLIDLSK